MGASNLGWVHQSYLLDSLSLAKHIAWAMQ